VTGPQALVVAPGQRGGGALVAVPPALSSGPDLRALLRALGRRWVLAMFLGLVCAGGAAAAAWFLLSPKHTAFAKILVKSYRPYVRSANIDTPAGQAEAEAYKKLQASELTSRFVLNDALKKDQVKRLLMIQEQPEPLTWLEGELKVDAKEHELVTLSLAGTDPDELVAMVHGVVHSYLDEVVKKEEDDRRGRVLKLQKTYTEAKIKLRGKYENLRDRSSKIGGADIEQLRVKQSMLLSDLGEVKRQHTGVEFELIQSRARLAAHKARKKDLHKLQVPETAVTAALEADLVAKQYLTRIALLDETIAHYEENARNPYEASLLSARRARAALKRKLAARKLELKKDLQKRFAKVAQEEYRAELSRLESVIGPLAKQETDLRRKKDRMTRDADKVGASSTDIDLLRDEIRQEEDFVGKLGSHLANLELEVQAGPRVTLYQEAGLQKVDLKRRLIATAMAPVAALVMVCFGVGWWEFRARRIQSADEVATGLGMRVVGAVPALPGPALGRLVATSDAQDVHESSLLESIDGIRTMLLRDASVEATRVVMVTSAVAGEGKTTLASNLATSLARAGRRTLLLDCDLRCPAAHQLFEQTLQPGLSEILLGEVDLVDAIRPTTAIEGLWLIPAGQWDREVLQALARQGLHDIFERLKDEFDFLIVDSHPVLPATDSLLVGQYADAVLLSLMRDVSQAPRVHAAYQRLTNLGIRVLGAVVNGMPTDAYEHGGPYLTAAPR
jgi:capsular exopolysaccharide synthesis family protein